MRSPQRLAAALAIGSLLTAACGARLTPAQHAAALSQSGGSGNGPITNGTATTGPNANGTATTGPNANGTATTGPNSNGTATTGPGGQHGGTGPGTSGPGTGTSDWIKAPAGGNGGHTDVGITADSITIANISDVSGPVPGLFEDARFAVQAYVKYFTARYGTIYGRKLDLKTYDSQLDTGANRSASIEACDAAFAGVGSVSAFDQGGAEPTKSCGIPDLRGLATTDAMKGVPNVYPINAAGTGGMVAMATYGWAAKKFPDAIKKAAYIYIDGDVTRQVEQQDAEGARNILGYNWVAETAIGITETNYSSVVRDLKDKGARYVTFVGAYQQAARLAKEFASQGFKPDVFQPTITAYTPNFIKQAGSAAEGVYVSVAPSLNEEMQGNQELTTYAQWLNQVKPGATPTGIGQYAWAAAALFVEKMKELGPKPTRKGLLALVAKVHSYDGNGLFPAQDVGGRRLQDCVAVVQVKNGSFVRVEPAAPRSLRCGDGVWNSKTNKAEKGFPK
ncbi:MAG: ABC-type branched-chain amino acid transport system periplasmic component-like protein [Frankiales bacterium]|nr:ABC-type branched-chain amino acid transport system periplasmic component-like protein [Frankiales bacterium]